MATPYRLDPVLLKKVSKKSGKEIKYLRESISRRASREGKSSEAILVNMAQAHGIGVNTYLRKLPQNVRQDASTMVPILQKISPIKGKPSTKRASSTTLNLRGFIKDEELLDRCKDLLRASKHFDRVYREATTVFEDRLKSVCGLGDMRPEDLVGKALNPNPALALLVVSNDKSKQEGFHSLCKGVVLSFRNTSHHKLIHTYTREDAIIFCGFIDMLLSIIGQAKKQTPQTQP